MQTSYSEPNRFPRSETILDRIAPSEVTKERDGTTTVTYSINFDRWKSMAAGLYLEFLCGLIYAFPVYSGQLKLILDANQEQLSWCSTFGTMGGNLGILAGIYYDLYGSKSTSTLGAFIAFVGFFCIYLVTTKALPLGIWGAAVFYFIAYQGLTWMDTTVVGVQVTNFPKDKGLAVGLVKTQFGLAASAIVVISVGFFGGESTVSTTRQCSGSDYLLPMTVDTNSTSGNTDVDTSGGLPLLLFFALLVLSLGTTASFFLRFATPTYNNGKLGHGGKMKVYAVYGLVIALMVYLTTVSMINVQWRKNDAVPPSANLIFAVVQIILYSFPFFLILKTKRSQGIFYKNLDYQDQIASKESQATVPSMHDFTYWQALASLDFWCLFFIFFGGTGAAYMTINQLTQINFALGGSAADQAVLVILVGVANCTGRIILGFLQDRVAASGFTRPLLCFVAIFLMGVGQIILSTATNNGPILYIGVFVTCFAFGCTWTLIGPTTSDICGPSNFGKVFSTISMAAMASTLIFNQGIAGPTYDDVYAKSDYYPNPTKTCCGSQCYTQAHLFAALASFIVSVAPLVLYCRSRQFYRDYYKRSENQPSSGNRAFCPCFRHRPAESDAMDVVLMDPAESGAQDVVLMDKVMGSKASLPDDVPSQEISS